MVQEASYSSFSSLIVESEGGAGWAVRGAAEVCEDAETKLPNIMQIHLVILYSL